MEVDSSDDEIEALGFKFFFDSEDFIKRVWLFGVSDFKGEGEELDFWFLDVFGKAGGRAIDTDLDLPAQSHTLGVLQFIEDSPANIIDEAFKLDGMTLLTEVEPAPVKTGVQPL